MYIRICVYIYMYIYIYIHAHMYAYIYTCTYLYVYKCTCIHSLIHPYIDILTRRWPLWSMSTCLRAKRKHNPQSEPGLCDMLHNSQSNILHHTASFIMQHTTTHRSIHHNAIHYNTPQHTAKHCHTFQGKYTRQNEIHSSEWDRVRVLSHHSHCNTLQHTAAYCNTLQHTATHRHTL